MSKIKTLLLFTALILILYFLTTAKIKLKEYTQYKRTASSEGYKYKEKEIKIEGIGEKIAYDIKLGGMTLGKATFEHIESAVLNGKLLSVMVFKTNLPRFKDIEIIYSDPETMLPIKIERDILNFFSREKITELYDQEKFTVTINKQKGGREESILIKKDNFIHNAILLPQYIRYMTKLNLEKTLSANLPTRQYQIKFVSEEEIEVPAGKFKTYHFSSSPKQIEVWLSADQRRIPVKIQSTAVFNYLMVLRESNF